MMAELGGGLEQELHAEADAEQGAAGGGEGQHRLVEAAGPEALHGVAEGAHAGEDRAARRRRTTAGSVESRGAPADRGHRLGDAPQVAAAVVHDHHGARRAHAELRTGTSAWASRALISPTVYLP